MDEATKALVEAYDRQRKQTRKKLLWLLCIIAGAALIIGALLFRTQYPMHLENKGWVHYSYSHILLRDQTNYNFLNDVKHHQVKYYIVYRNAALYYEQETDFATYSAHASKENAQPGITNHSLIRESADKYTFLAKNGRTYCYDEKTSVWKALFDASYAGGNIYWRFVCYGAAAVMAGIGIGGLKRRCKKEKRLTTDEKENQNR